MDGSVMGIDLGQVSVSTTVDLPATDPITLLDVDGLKLSAVLGITDVTTTSSVWSGYEASGTLTLALSFDLLVHTFTTPSITLATLKAQKCTGTGKYWLIGTSFPSPQHGRGCRPDWCALLQYRSAHPAVDVYRRVPLCIAT